MQTKSHHAVQRCRTHLGIAVRRPAKCCPKSSYATVALLPSDRRLILTHTRSVPTTVRHKWRRLTAFHVNRDL